MEKSDQVRKPLDCYEVDRCRGIAGRCPFSLADNSELAADIVQAVSESAWAQRKQSGPSHYKQLRIALANCPNACTQPQIKDIGVIATSAPEAVGPDCNGCRQCEDVCQEGAIVVRDGQAELTRTKCVGCGLCFLQCARGALGSRAVQFRILVGGKMGRHPRWAQELCVVDSSRVVKALQSFLQITAHHAKPTERIASVIERLGVAKLKEECFS